nr:hypothetical protein [Tanacetum cinerariifolium]
SPLFNLISTQLHSKNPQSTTLFKATLTSSEKLTRSLLLLSIIFDLLKLNRCASHNIKDVDSFRPKR